MFPKTSRTLTVAVALLWLAPPNAAPAPQGNPQQDQFAGVRATIRRTLDSGVVSSMAVAVAKGGRIVWEEGFGVADRETKRPSTAETMYSLASISKPFTATGLMLLVERGKIDLGKPANEYLGKGKLTGLAGDAREATVRRVMSHTAGLPLHYQFFYADQPYGPPSMDETIARYGNLVFAPGSLYEYSNLGFGIIDHIIEQVSSQKYADYMRAQVFQPLGLTHTSIGIGAGLEAFAAQRYDAQKKPIPFYVFDHMGASAVYSSAHDLVRFGMFHLKDHLADQRAILTDATLDLMHTAVAPANYGLGWAILESDQGFRRINHTGGMPGVSTTLNLYPSENLAVVVLSGTGAPTGQIAQDIAAAVLPSYADRLRVSRAAPPAAAPSSEIGKLAGEWSGTLKTWKSTLPFRLSVRGDGGVFAAIADQPQVSVTAPVFRNGRLGGRLAARIPTEDAGRWPHTVLLGLQLVDGVLKGQVSAQATTYYSLASYAELRKQ